MDAFTVVFVFLIFDFFAVIIFFAKALAELDRDKFRSYRYLGPLLLLFPGVLTRLGYRYLLVSFLLGLLFLVGFYLLSAVLI